MKGKNFDAFKQPLAPQQVPQIHSKLLKSFDSLGSHSKKSAHPRYKS